MNEGSERRDCVLILLSALLAALPLVIRGASCGHDFDFHLQSWLAVAQQWRQAVAYPHWIEAANYGAGEPRLVFYPPLTWMLGALLGTILPWAVVPAAFTLILLAASAFAIRKLAREWLPQSASTVAACAYILNPYTLFVAYERTAYGELAGGIWLPLILLYALRAAPAQSPRLPAGIAQRGREGPAIAPVSNPPILATNTFVPLSLTIAAIWLSNAPAAVMACYTLAVVTACSAFARRQWQPIVNSTLGVILGLGLAAFYLTPAAYERRWVDIARAIGPGMRVQDSFFFGHTGESFHDQVLRTASWIFVILFAAIAITASIAWKRQRDRTILLLPAAAAALFALQLRWSDILWRHAPELKFLQFPWRWTLVLSIILALSVAAATVQRSVPLRKRPRYPAVTLIAALALVGTGSWLFWQPCDEEDAVSAQLAVFRAGTGFEGTDEYTPLGADNSLIQQGLPQVRVLRKADAETAPDPPAEDQNNSPYAPSSQDHIAAEFKIDQWQSERKSLTISSPSPGFAVLRLMDYPAWQVRLNGSPVLDRLHRDDGLMTVPVRIGVTRIEIKYAATADVWAGRAISTASLVIVILVAALRRNHSNLGEGLDDNGVG